MMFFTQGALLPHDPINHLLTFLVPLRRAKGREF